MESAALRSAAKITLPLPLPSREGDKALSPGGRGKGEGAFKTSDKAPFSLQFTADGDGFYQPMSDAEGHSSMLP